MQTLWSQMLCGEQKQGIGPGGASQPPLPQAKPPQLVSAKPAAPAADLVALKPGTLLTVDGRATVIPRLRP